MIQSTGPKDRIGVTKVPLSIIPLVAQVEEALALFNGQLKYGRTNWAHETVACHVYLDAALRHIAQFAAGQSTDPESGAHHLGHARACLAIILDAQLRGKLVDDRTPCIDAKSILDAGAAHVKSLLETHTQAQDFQ